MSFRLSIERLALEARMHGRERSVVDRVSLSVSQGESLALVGESGSGKTLLALTVMGLLPEPQIAVREGRIEWEGANLLALSASARRRVVGREIAMIFQEPMTSLNPVMRIGEQIVEMIRAHEAVSRRAASARAAELLRAVQIPEPAVRLAAYPHQLSGGQCQRVMIAIALACGPKLLIADEPTTALDVTVQAQILGLLRERQANLNMGLLFITHDLGVVANVADRIAVIYCGQIVESGPVHDIFRAPGHPYTRALIDCIPDARRIDDLLVTIPGQIPGPSENLAACRFAPRCARADEGCVRRAPPAAVISPNQVAYCHHPLEAREA